MDSALKDDVYQLIQDFTGEPAYKKSQFLSAESQSLFARMQTELVNAHHLLGDVEFVNAATQNVDTTAAVRSLESFVQHASAAKALQLILPNHLVAYQDRSLKIIKALDKSYQ